MERKPVTLTEDLSTLVNGGIQAGEFTDRSSAIRRCLREYFRTHLVETAALLVENEELDVEAVAEALEIDRQRLRDVIAAIDEDRAPAAMETYLDDIVGDFRVDETDGALSGHPSSDRTEASPDE